MSFVIDTTGRSFLQDDEMEDIVSSLPLRKEVEVLMYNANYPADPFVREGVVMNVERHFMSTSIFFKDGEGYGGYLWVSWKLKHGRSVVGWRDVTLAC